MFKEERFQGSREVGAINAPYRSEAMSGLFKARITGNQLETDNQFLEILFNGQSMYARPCYGFGSRISAPSKNWLDKFKNEIFVWVIFEEAEFRSPVWLGWCFNEGKQTNLYDFPDSDIYRTEKFEEIFNDKTNEYRLRQTENKKQEIAITDTGLDITAEKGTIKANDTLDVTTENTVTFKQSNLTNETSNKTLFKQTQLDLIADKIYVGKEEAMEPAVLGNLLNTNLTSIINLLTQLTTALTTFTQTQGVAASSATPLNPLSAGYTVLQANVTNITTNIQTVTSQLTKHLSNKITLE